MSKGIETLRLFIQVNKEREQKLIPKGYKPLEQTKAYDDAFNKPCELDSIKIDKLIELCQ